MISVCRGWWRRVTSCVKRSECRMTDEVKLRLDIDKHRLDEEWAEQPNQFYYWSIKAANAQLAYDAAKSELALQAAKLDREIREDPSAFGVGKINNDVVEAAVLQQPEYKAHQKTVGLRYNELLHYRAAVDALEHRKRALTMLVELYTREYFADSHSRKSELTEDEIREVRQRGQRKWRQQMKQEDQSDE